MTQPVEWDAPSHLRLSQPSDSTLLSQAECYACLQPLISGDASSVEAYRELREKIVGIASLSDDWDGYGAAAMSQVALDFAARLLNAHEYLRVKLSPPEISPTPNGTIAIEWQENGGDAMLEIGLTKISGFIRPQSGRSIYIAETQRDSDENTLTLLVDAIISSGTKGADPVSRVNYEIKGRD